MFLRKKKVIIDMVTYLETFDLQPEVVLSKELIRVKDHAVKKLGKWHNSYQKRGLSLERTLSMYYLMSALIKGGTADLSKSEDFFPRVLVYHTPQRMLNTWLEEDLIEALTFKKEQCKNSPREVQEEGAAHSFVERLRAYHKKGGYRLGRKLHKEMYEYIRTEIIPNLIIPKRVGSGSGRSLR